MPTRGRNGWASEAVYGFITQDYPDKELIVLDDDDAPSFRWAHPGTTTDNIHYYRQSTRSAIPEKRNRCCEMASGEIIIHFDDDDWSAATRMTDQVERLRLSGKAVTGYRSLLFFDATRRQVGRYQGSANYALGTSLAYRRDWWASHRFEHVHHGKPNEHGIGEDNQFVFQAAAAGELVTVDGGAMMVGRAHAGNTSAKDVSGYTPVPLEDLPLEFRRLTGLVVP